MKRFVLTLGLAGIMLAYGQSNDHYRQLLSEINEKITGDPGNLSLYYSRADIYDQMNDFANANKDYKKVITLYKAHPDSNFSGEFSKSCYRLADDYFFRNSNSEEALKYVSEGLQVSEDFKDLMILEAMILGNDQDRREEALEKFNKLSVKYPNDVRVSLQFAKFLEGFDALGAAAQYEKVLAADPQNEEVLLSLGTIYNNEATRLSSEVITKPRMIYDLAKKASGYFERLHQMNPNDKEVMTLLAILYDELNEQEMADKMKQKPPY